MTERVLFLTHADVVIDPDVAVADWTLNETGRARHSAFAADDAVADVATIFCSAERKAKDGAEIAAAPLGVTPRVRPELGENDRTATGYLPRTEFEAVADLFFAEPDTSVRGWETAAAAQQRIVQAVRGALAEDRPQGDVLFVGHGATAALLRCHLLDCPITRDEDQPGNGGCWYAFDPGMQSPPSAWSVI